MIPVTKPFLPPKEEYQHEIQTIWDTNWLTNSGPLNNKLEKKLQDFLEISNVLFVNSGTSALQMAIRALHLKGEIITTPFSFVATSSSIVWENCKPVYVDIEATSLNIDATKIEEAITPQTSAILATHVYGNACEIDEIEQIAKKYHLKVIYDAAHAFGVTYKGKSIFEFGDISICSTHATKIFHTTEGGFITTKKMETYNELKAIRNFGFKDSVSFSTLGINAKNSEFHAAMGLVNLRYIASIITRRAAIFELYNNHLDTMTEIVRPIWNNDSSQAYAYYPVVFESEKALLKCSQELENNKIIARRYFYPCLSKSLPYVTADSMPIADTIASRVLCLPLYYALTNTEVLDVCNIIKSVLQNNFVKS